MEEDLEKLKRMYDLSWFIAERWFRAIEFSLILGVIAYFKETLKAGVAFDILYLLSWTFFWGWFQDMANLLAEKINRHRQSKYKRIMVWIICTIIVGAIYVLVNHTANLIITKQYS